MEDVKAIELIGKLTKRFTRTCPPTPEYQSRLAEEFEIILDLRFVDYFLQIRDILDLTQDIPHMTRGSAGSSLVCYLMGITDVDPIQWDIPVARFLNPKRDDPGIISLFHPGTPCAFEPPLSVKLPGLSSPHSLVYGGPDRTKPRGEMICISLRSLSKTSFR